MTLLTKGMGAIIKGKAQGGRIGKLAGGPMRQGIGRLLEKLGGSEKGKPHSTRAGRRAAGSRRLKRGLKEISTPFIDESIFIKQFKKMKKDKVTPELTGLLTGIKNISKDQSKLGKGKERTKKGLGGALKVAKAIASKVFKKKPVPKPAPKEPKIGSKEWFDKQDPFVRNRILGIRESAKRGDVYNKAGTVVGTPSPHRTAEAIKKRHPGSYQLSTKQTKSGKK